MTAPYAAGGNYRIEIERGVATCRVWRRPDVDAATGALYAQEKIAHFEALARGPVRGMIFDLREAPPVTGPRTRAAIGEMIGAFERAGRRIALVAGEHPTQRLQLRSVVDELAPMHGRVFHDVASATAWARADSAPPR